MRHDLQKQRGMTGIGWLLVLFLIGFFTLLTFKLVPSYLENYTIKSVLSSLEEEPLITTKSAHDVERMIMARLNTNGVREVKSDAVKIEKKPGQMKITIAYNVQKHLLGNVDVVMKFENYVELVGH
jgi:hypothetical protein